MTRLWANDVCQKWYGHHIIIYFIAYISRRVSQSCDVTLHLSNCLLSQVENLFSMVCGNYQCRWSIKPSDMNWLHTSIQYG